MKVIINAKQKYINKKALSYAEICTLAKKEPYLKPTVSYKIGKESGTVISGTYLDIDDGMIINVINA